MASFDALFPNRSDCYFALFQDVVYIHDDSINYIFEADQFKRRDRVAVVNQIAAMADLLYENLVAQDAAFSRCQPIIDYPSLLSVFTRYSRDIYGFRRISAKIRNMEKTLDENQRDQLEKIISEGADFGFKLEIYPDLLLNFFSQIKKILRPCASSGLRCRGSGSNPAFREFV